ncbi:hypothetical protein [Sediminibacillus terrae]|uniref:hypothetical protein n=1 Tax=Sediminibacillus terrae TaxID=1562106 RepID=UPI00129519E5|nr:hypothetical protein [Sediminibacillus terrae]
MAKPDLIKEVIEEFPEKNFNAEQLNKDYTVQQLEDLQEKLRKEKGSADGDDDKSEETTEANTADTSSANTEKSNESVNKEQQDSASKKKYRLKDPSTQYAEKGFTLAGKQVKELPENPSSELQDRIDVGFIIEVK